ncbi:MAG: hypothetical protein MK008_07170 [Bdellovibrionales bacterium]|nr:hypothetical protein [Bdellovibrionales bacterium]
MPTLFVTLSLFLVSFSAHLSYADSCLDVAKQDICYDIENTQDVSEIPFESPVESQSMLVASDLAQNQMDDILVVSSDLFKISEDQIEPSIYETFSKADDLYYRFAYKILDRNNSDTTVVITRD